ncbi:MAG: hypothetical protein M3Y44_11350 [Actinomycetota bacterium]|nr:hypothetical protein [Actinomycetota bacterium]
MAVVRILSSCAAVVAVAGCASLALAMAGATNPAQAPVTPYAMPTRDVPSDPAAATPIPHRTGAVAQAAPRPASVAHAVTPRPSVTARVQSTVRQPASKAAAGAAPKTVPKATARAIPRATPKPTLRRGQALPVAGTTAGATRVITVRASSSRSTVATLQAWVAAPGGGWLAHGGPIPAHIGADGLSSTPGETRSATPVGSFTLTQAFGAYANPGTALPYFPTNSSDWWISQAGPLYNTHQHCASGCGFTHGAPNEHLAYELPYYRYAVVIDYNTRNAPGGVHQGRGSAFFLHVTDGSATAGCVAISQTNLVAVMKWLTPAAHPRILLGVA